MGDAAVVPAAVTSKPVGCVAALPTPAPLWDCDDVTPSAGSDVAFDPRLRPATPISRPPKRRDAPRASDVTLEGGDVTLKGGDVTANDGDVTPPDVIGCDVAAAAIPAACVTSAPGE